MEAVVDLVAAQAGARGVEVAVVVGAAVEVVVAVAVVAGAAVGAAAGALAAREVMQVPVLLPAPQHHLVADLGMNLAAGEARDREDLQRGAVARTVNKFRTAEIRPCFHSEGSVYHLADNLPIHFIFRVQYIFFFYYKIWRI